MVFPYGSVTEMSFSVNYCFVVFAGFPITLFVFSLLIAKSFSHVRYINTVLILSNKKIPPALLTFVLIYGFFFCCANKI